MRIPSQFNEDSLYRSSRRSTQSVQSHRRLLRLILGLALVLVLMRQAARPEIYRLFFGAPAVTAAPVVFESDGQLDTGDGPVLAPPAVSAEDRRTANALAGALSKSDQRLWTAVLSRWLRGMPIPEYPSSVEILTEQLDQMEELESSKRSDWLGMLSSVEQRVSTQVIGPTDAGTGELFAPADSAEATPTGSNTVASGSNAAAELPRPKDSDLLLATAFLESLDSAAESRVVDGSVWRSGDFDAFYRYLDQAPEFTPNGLAATSVLPLLQQPDVFRGQLVRVQGTVARAERIDASDNLFEIESYWQLWLRPSDGVERPLVVIVPKVRDEVKAVGSGTQEVEGPSVVVAGRFLKRLAYTSSMGADLAPVVVGQIAYPVSTPEVAMQPEVAPKNADLTLQITIVLACVFGVALAVFATWRTTAAARVSRRLRFEHRPGPDFDGIRLADATVEVPPNPSESENL